MAEDVGQPVTKELGNFVAGELPDPVVYQFQTAVGGPKDLSSSTVEFHISKDGATPALGTGTADLDPVISPAPFESFVRYAWASIDMAAGHYEAMFWVTKGANVFASKKIVWYVSAGIKAP